MARIGERLFGLDAQPHGERLFELVEKGKGIELLAEHIGIGDDAVLGWSLDQGELLVQRITESGENEQKFEVSTPEQMTIPITDTIFRGIWVNLLLLHLNTID